MTVHIFILHNFGNDRNGIGKKQERLRQYLRRYRKIIHHTGRVSNNIGIDIHDAGRNPHNIGRVFHRTGRAFTAQVAVGITSVEFFTVQVAVGTTRVRLQPQNPIISGEFYKSDSP